MRGDLPSLRGLFVRVFLTSRLVPLSPPWGGSLITPKGAPVAQCPPAPVARFQRGGASKPRSPYLSQSVSQLDDVGLDWGRRKYGP